jgi:hypothetical protein
MSLRSLFMVAVAMLGLASGTAAEKEQAGIPDHRLFIQIALYWVKGLKPGSPVTVNESDVFDYIWIKPDGSREGNETGKILLEKAEKEGR